MKKCFVALVVVLFSFQAKSAVYSVSPNDTLTRISHLTGHSVSQLQAMNDIADPDSIRVGHQISYLSSADLKSAQLWCEFWGPLSSAANAEYFRYAADDLNSRTIRYSINEDHGLHFDLVLAFAKAWNEL